HRANLAPRQRINIQLQLLGAAHVPIAALIESEANAMDAVRVEKIHPHVSFAAAFWWSIIGCGKVAAVSVLAARHLLERNQFLVPTGIRIPAGLWDCAPAFFSLGTLARELPADLSRNIGINEIQWQHRPLAETVAELLETATSMRFQEPPYRQRIEPDGPERDVRSGAGKDWRDDGAPWRLQHALNYRRAAFHGNCFGSHRTGNEFRSLTDAFRVAADFLQEQIDLINQPGGGAPGGEAIVPGGEAGAAGHRHARHLELRRAQVGQIPLRRQSRKEVRVVGHQWLAADGPIPCDYPLVR